MQAGADPNARGYVGNTAIGRACHGGHAGALRALLTAPQIDLNVPNEKQQFPLHFAAFKQHPEVLAQTHTFVALVHSHTHRNPCLRTVLPCPFAMEASEVRMLMCCVNDVMSPTVLRLRSLTVTPENKPCDTPVCRR